MKTETPLLRFLRALNPDDRKAFCEACGTTLLYLYQIAGKEEPNPTLKLAKALVENSRTWQKKIPKVLKVAPLTYDDLLVGAQVIDQD